LQYCPPDAADQLRLAFRKSGDAQLLAILTELDEAKRPGLQSLTPREREVASLLARGNSNKQIATALFITPATAKLHVRHIFEKLNVSSRTEAALRIAAAPRFQAAPPPDDA